MQTQSDADNRRMMMVKRDILEEMGLQRRIGRILRWGRKKKKFSAKRFAALLEINPKELVLIESGEARLPMCLLVRAVDHLHYKVQMRIEILMMEMTLLMRDEVPRRMTMH